MALFHLFSVDTSSPTYPMLVSCCRFLRYCICQGVEGKEFRLAVYGSSLFDLQNLLCVALLSLPAMDVEPLDSNGNGLDWKRGNLLRQGTL